MTPEQTIEYARGYAMGWLFSDAQHEDGTEHTYGPGDASEELRDIIDDLVNSDPMTY